MHTLSAHTHQKPLHTIMATWLDLPKDIRKEIIKNVATQESQALPPMLQRFAYGVYIRKYYELEFLININTYSFSRCRILTLQEKFFQYEDKGIHKRRK